MIRSVYTAEDSQGDRIYSGVLNGMASRAMAAAHGEVDVPVYLEFGPLYWGYWREEDGLNDDDYFGHAKRRLPLLPVAVAPSDGYHS